MSAGFPLGTFDQMDEVLEPGETRKDFLRKAVDKELKQRRKLRRRPRGPDPKS